MGRTITKTFEEIDKEWTPEKIRAVLDNAPSFPKVAAVTLAF
jgi:hypothetical protein